jgi:hypothetical protein
MVRRGPGSARRAVTTAVVAVAVVSGPVTALASPAQALEPRSAVSAVTAAKLVLHYDFEDVAAGVVPDSSPSGLDGTLVNPAAASAVTSVNGSQALLLPGGASSSATAPYVSVPNGLFKDLHATTISTWLKWSGGPDFQWVYNLGKDLNTATFATPSFEGDATTRSSIKPVNGSAEVGVPGTAKLPANQWVNLVTTIDGSSITYYVNGASLGSRTASIDLAKVMYSASNPTSGFLGKPFWGGHPFLAGAIDDFRVYDSALSPAEVAELAGSHLATPTGAVPTTIEVLGALGTPPPLPATVNADFSDGMTRPLAIEWNAVDPAQYATRGTFTVPGRITALDRAVTAKVTVKGADLTVDLSKNTGPVHGGASGTLYGLYGEGLPSRNLIQGMNLRTVSTKAQDGPQHPGADALEVVKPLADSTGGDVYIYMTDIYRGFPYEWPGNTPQARLDDFISKIGKQVDQALTLDKRYQDRIVFVPFNEPEGNMFGTGNHSYNGVSWLSDPGAFFAAWDRAYKLIKGKMPQARIAGPNTSVLYDQTRGFLQHTLTAKTVPEVFTWHELSDPARIRASVAKYRGWENELFAGTAREGQHLPINLNEYAYNYHTSVPGQMIQWVSAIEESKVDADIAYWNIDGNLSDSAVQANRGNGQWWLLNAYGQLSGHTVRVTPPQPNVSYTLQGVAALDEKRRQARVIFGGASGESAVTLNHVDPEIFGTKVHALVQEIPWTGQLGDSAQPRVLAETTATVTDGTVTLEFGATSPGTVLPKLTESSAYQIILSPGKNATATQKSTTLWKATHEAEKAGHTGSGYTVNGPEGSPSDVAKFYTSGNYNVGGLRTGADVKLTFPMTVPQDGRYDLSVFANTLNTDSRAADQGPTNVFLTVDGGAEQELFLTLGYKWVVWDHTDTRVNLTKGDHVITLSSRSLDGTRTTKGDAIIDKIDLSLPNPAAARSVYEAEHAALGNGAKADYTERNLSGAGGVELGTGDTATFWVYAAKDSYATLGVDTARGGHALLAVNGSDLGNLKKSRSYTVYLRGGVNKVTLTGQSANLILDRIWLQEAASETAAPVLFEAENATVAGTAKTTPSSLASGGTAVTGVGGALGNGNTLTFSVPADRRGTYSLTIRYSNPEQSPASHYNPDPLARPADVTVNRGTPQRVLFPHTFHANNFWEQTVLVRLERGPNTIQFASQEQPNFDGTTYISTQYPDLLMRSAYAPVIDRIAVAPLVAD